MKTNPLSKHSKEQIEYLFKAWNKRVDLIYQLADVVIMREGKPKVFPRIYSVIQELDLSLSKGIDFHVDNAKLLEGKLSFLFSIGADIILEDYEINLLSIVKELDNKVRLFIIDRKLR